MDKFIEDITDGYRDLDAAITRFVERIDNGTGGDPLATAAWTEVGEAMAHLNTVIKAAAESPIDADAASMQPA